MEKKYTSTGKSQISLNVPLGGNAYVHITFTSMTDGSSVYYTDDEELQAALEKHPKYGILFEGKTISAPKTVAVKEEAPVSKVQEIPVNCEDDAKDYLADKFNISRTKMRSTKQILDIAKEHNIEFKGL